MLHSNYPNKIGRVKMRGEVWMEIRNDRQKGLSCTETARKYHINPRTAKNMRNPKQDRYTN